MMCPECGARALENWTIATVGEDDQELEIHTYRCIFCGWVTVQDWQWVGDDDDND